MSSGTRFASEGFDLDAASGTDVVFELGGGVSQVSLEEKRNEKEESKEKVVDPLHQAEEHKQKGNTAESPGNNLFLSNRIQFRPSSQQASTVEITAPCVTSTFGLVFCRGHTARRFSPAVRRKA